MMTAMMFLQLRDLAKRGVRIARQRASPVFNPAGRDQDSVRRSRDVECSLLAAKRTEAVCLRS